MKASPNGGGHLFCVRSIPFFTIAVSRMDVVRAAARSDESGFDFVAMERTGGHSTYMILAEPDEQKADAYMRQLLALKCEFEAKELFLRPGRRILFGVDVPSEATIHEVYDVLQRGEDAKIWQFQEGHVGHALKQG